MTNLLRSGIYTFGLILFLASLSGKAESVANDGIKNEVIQNSVQNVNQKAERRMSLEEFFMGSNNQEQEVGEPQQQQQFQQPQVQLQQSTDPNSVVFLRENQFPNPAGGLVSRLAMARRMLRLTRLMRRLRIIPRLIGLGLGRPLRQVTDPGALTLFSNRNGDGYNNEYDPRDFVFGNKGFNYNNTKDSNENYSGNEQSPQSQPQETKPYYNTNNNNLDSEEVLNRKPVTNYQIQSQLQQQPKLSSGKRENESNEKLHSQKYNDQTHLHNLQQYHQLLRNLQQLQDLQQSYYQPNQNAKLNEQNEIKSIPEVPIYQPTIQNQYQKEEQPLNDLYQDEQLQLDEIQQLHALNNMLSQMTREQQLQLLEQIQLYREHQLQQQEGQKLQQLRDEQLQMVQQLQQKNLQKLQQAHQEQLYQQPQYQNLQKLQQVQQQEAYQQPQQQNLQKLQQVHQEQVYQQPQQQILQKLQQADQEQVYQQPQQQNIQKLQQVHQEQVYQQPQQQNLQKLQQVQQEQAYQQAQLQNLQKLQQVQQEQAYQQAQLQKLQQTQQEQVHQQAQLLKLQQAQQEQAYQQAQLRNLQKLQQAQKEQTYQQPQSQNTQQLIDYLQKYQKEQIPIAPKSHQDSGIKYEIGSKPGNELYTKKSSENFAAAEGKTLSAGGKIVGVGINVGIKPPAIDIAVTKPVSSFIKPLPQLINPNSVKQPLNVAKVAKPLVPLGILSKPILKLNGRMFLGAEMGKNVKINTGAAGR